MAVPPGNATEAAELSKTCNHKSAEDLCEGQHNLLFHYVPDKKDGRLLNEDEGYLEPGGATRTLEDLSIDLVNCAAVVLLDNGEWEREYPRTLKVIQDWSVEHTEWPVVSIHINGIGRLIYSWCLLEAVTGENNQALYSRLLAQATTRGGQWYKQARRNRWLAIRFALTTLVVSLVAVFLSYSFWKRGSEYKHQAEAKAAMLTGLTSTGGRGSEQVIAAKSLAVFRNDSKPADMQALKKLLDESARQIKAVIERNSGASDVSVSMFSVTVDKSSIVVDEVAASRPGFTSSPYIFDTDLKNYEQWSIVDCAIVQGAFILWSGNSQSNSTTYIQGWDIDGSDIGPYDSKNNRLVTGRHVCSYQFEGAMKPQEIPQKAGGKDVPQRRLLCAPAGSTFNIHEPGNGAICVSVPHDVAFLSEPWVRFTLVRFGNALSFSPWGKSRSKK